MELIGIGIVGIILGALAGKKRHQKKRPLTPAEKQDATEQAAIVQPIVRGDYD